MDVLYRLSMKYPCFTADVQYDRPQQFLYLTAAEYQIRAGATFVILKLKQYIQAPVPKWVYSVQTVLIINSNIRPEGKLRPLLCIPTKLLKHHSYFSHLQHQQPRHIRSASFFGGCSFILVIRFLFVA